MSDSLDCNQDATANWHRLRYTELRQRLDALSERGAVSMQSNLFAVSFAAIVLLVPASAYAQSLPDASTDVQAEVDSVNKTSRMLLGELRQNELTLYELFNRLNSSDEFDITCESELDQPAELALQLCEPVFLEKIRQQVSEELARDSTAASGLIARIRNAFSSQEARAENLVQERAAVSIQLLQQEMEMLAAANPSLAMQMQKVGQLQLVYLETIRNERDDRDYLMRENDPTYGQAFQNSGRRSEPRPWLSAPPPGHTQPRIHFPADANRR